MSGTADSLAAAFFDSAESPLAVLDIGGVVLRLNAAWRAVVPDPKSQEGKPFLSLFSADDARLFELALTELASGVERTVRARLAAFEGTFRVMLDAQGTHIHVSASLRAQGVEDTAAKTSRLFAQVVEQASLVLWAMDADGVCTLSSGRGLEILASLSGSAVGQNMFDIYKDAPDVLGAVVRALAGEEARIVSTVGQTHFDTWLLPVREADGSISGVVGLAIDVTERAESEKELRDKLELIGRQSATIRALATPIIQIWDEVLCLPVIGTVDSARTADMMQGLLESIVREQARYAIVDLTGVDVVDTSTADHLIRLFRAAKVLGVDGILCGIRPAVAQTVVGLGLDLASVRTMRSLRDALHWCMRARAKAAVHRAGGLRAVGAKSEIGAKDKVRA
jgi:rsbT co-antagonist protein RsbR